MEILHRSRGLIPRIDDSKYRYESSVPVARTRFLLSDIGPQEAATGNWYR